MTYRGLAVSYRGSQQNDAQSYYGHQQQTHGDNMKTRNANDILDHSIEMTEWQLKVLKKLKDANSLMSGNGRDSILECFARIATNERDNPLYKDAAKQMHVLSHNIRALQEEMRCSIDNTIALANHFNVYEVKSGKSTGWFHQMVDFETA